MRKKIERGGGGGGGERKAVAGETLVHLEGDAHSSTVCDLMIRIAPRLHNALDFNHQQIMKLNISCPVTIITLLHIIPHTIDTNVSVLCLSEDLCVFLVFNIRLIIHFAFNIQLYMTGSVATITLKK